MACNCSNNPCSCPGANCACPPSYVVNPATLTCVGTTCEDTLQTNCIFTDNYLSCSGVAAGSTLSVALAAMDAMICECAGCSGNTHISPNIDDMSTYWVDSSNTVAGDGSVTNPFWTLELAYNKIIGSGTTAVPDNSDITVMVMPGVGYTTSQNIYIQNTTWHFLSRTSVTFTGVGTYFIDSSTVGTNVGGVFIVLGYLDWGSSTGGFLKQEGYYGTTQKTILIEALNIIGLHNGQGMPLIYQNQTNVAASGAPIITYIKLKPLGQITSLVENTVSYTGGSLTIDLNGGTMVYGYSYLGVAGGLSTGYLVYYNSIDSSAFKYFNDLKIMNGAVYAANCTNMISINGFFTNITFDNIKCNTYAGTKPSHFMNIGTCTVFPNPGSGQYMFLMRNVYLDFLAFSITSPPSITVIQYTGAGNFDYLQMQDCILSYLLNISSTIRLGLLSSGTAITTKNIIGSNLTLTNIPTSSAGLPTGQVWSSSGALQIV